MIAVFVGVGFLGMGVHFLKRVLREETEISFSGYILNNKKATVSAIISMLAAVLGLLATGHVTMDTQTIALAFFAGYGADSAINKE